MRCRSEFKYLRNTIISRYDEIEKHDFENVENNLPPNWKQFNAIGHFTQVVWKRATKMGVGKALLQIMILVITIPLKHSKTT